ncbi:MAG: hypothetical protein ACLRZH_01340 [Ruthenibacterium lactatiformans]
MVTVDGQVVNAGGSFTGGSVSRSAGLFSRKQEIDELKKKVEALESSGAPRRKKPTGRRLRWTRFPPS